MYTPVTYPEHIEPLVRFVEETAPGDIVGHTYDKLHAGVSIKEMLLASALAAIRSSDLPPGHHGGPLHPVSGLHAVRHIAARLSGDYALMPVVQNVALSNKHIHSPAMGPYILAEAEPLSENDSIEDTLAAMPYHLARGAYNALDHYYLYFMEKLTPMQVLDHLLQVAIPKNQADDHNFLFPVFAWRALEYFGWDYAKYIARSAVRYVTRPPAARATLEIDTLIEDHGLLRRVPRFKTGPDETPAVVALRDTIGQLDEFDGIPAILAQALADGLSLEGTIEGLSLGGSELFLRSQTGNPMDVHIHTGANIRRYLLGQRELGMATRLRALLSWHTGPEVRSAQYKLAPQQQPEAARVAALPARGQDGLLGDIEDLIASLPVGERLPSLGLAQWRCSDEVKHAAALARQYVDCKYDPEVLFDALARIACRDNFTEMHAFKHHQATYEEYYATRPELRDTHLVSAVQAAAISHGRIQDVYADADKVVHF
jgi:hypothetical protein